VEGQLRSGCTRKAQAWGRLAAAVVRGVTMEGQARVLWAMIESWSSV